MAAVKHLVSRLGTVADRLRPPPTGITILIYHRVGGGTDSAVDLPAADFEWQLEHLAAHHRVLTLDEAVAELGGGRPAGWSGTAPDGAPDRAGVVVTFDDGTADFGEVVVPLLVRHGVPATLFVATRFVESGEPFPWGAPPASWDALCEAMSTGLVAVESHTHGHALLDRLDPHDVEHDLDRSSELIADRLGRRPRHFAYPKAILGSPAAEVAVRRRFVSASLARNRVNRPTETDLHRLWRTPVQRTDDRTTFAAKVVGGHRLEGELRELAGRVRHRGLVS